MRIPKVIRNISVFTMASLALASCQNDPWEVDTDLSKAAGLKFVHFADSVVPLDSIGMMMVLEHMAPRHPIMFDAEWRENFPPYLQSEAVQTLYRDAVNARPDLPTWEADVSRSYAKLMTWLGGSESDAYIYTYISQAEPHDILVGPSTIFLPWDRYLGEDHPLYGQEAYYQARMHHPDVAAARIVVEWIRPFQPAVPNSPTLLSAMLHEARFVMAIEACLGEAYAYRYLGMTQEHREFINEHERELWSAFVEQRWLYSSDLDLKRKLIQPAPFSKLGSEHDMSIPGRLATWFGWQILREYWRENPEFGLSDILAAVDDQVVLRQSGYRP